MFPHFLQQKIVSLPSAPRTAMLARGPRGVGFACAHWSRWTRRSASPPATVLCRPDVLHVRGAPHGSSLPHRAIASLQPLPAPPSHASAVQRNADPDATCVIIGASRGIGKSHVRLPAINFSTSDRNLSTPLNVCATLTPQPLRPHFYLSTGLAMTRQIFARFRGKVVALCRRPSDAAALSALVRTLKSSTSATELSYFVLSAPFR